MRGGGRDGGGRQSTKEGRTEVNKVRGREKKNEGTEGVGGKTGWCCTVFRGVEVTVEVREKEKKKEGWKHGEAGSRKTLGL